MAQFIDFGTGREGSLNISAANLGGIAGFGVATVTGTAGQYSCVKTDCGYFNTGNGGRDGDMVFIHQSKGTGAGQWEVNYIASTSGTTVNLLYPLTYTYVAGAQMYTSPQLYNGTISGTLGPYSAWQGSFGGVIFLVDKGTLTVSGSILNYGNMISAPGVGSSGNPAGGLGGGFRGGSGDQVNNDGQGGGQCGENTNATWVWSGNQACANGGGGGTFSHPYGVGLGGGGGNGTAGENGSVDNSNCNPGIGGAVSGNAELTLMTFGGGGGAGAKEPTYTGGGGGSGGGIVVIFAKNIIIRGTGINVNGGSGSNAAGAGAGGAGGSILLKGQNIDIGTNICHASYGNRGISGSDYAGRGGYGRIRAEYSDTFTGSGVDPSLSTAQVTTLKKQIYGGMV